MRVRTLAYVVVAIGSWPPPVVTSRVHDARRQHWPPTPGADMTDPANWPNDPGYQGDWNYWSWLPKQTAGHAAVPRRRPEARRQRHEHRQGAGRTRSAGPT